MSIGNDRYEYTGPRCVDCKKVPDSEYEIGSWKKCGEAFPCDGEDRCENCASTHVHICPHCRTLDCGYDAEHDICPVYEAARAEAR